MVQPLNRGHSESEFEPWEADHTGLVHVLWDAGIDGREADELASKIMQSRWMEAVCHFAAAGQEHPPA